MILTVPTFTKFADVVKANSHIFLSMERKWMILYLVILHFIIVLFRDLEIFLAEGFNSGNKYNLDFVLEVVYSPTGFQI